jgi:hypothetical protein
MPDLYMFSGNVNDTSRVIRMAIIGDATAYSFTPNDSRGVTYDCNVFFIIQATGLVWGWYENVSCAFGCLFLNKHQLNALLA